MKNVAHEDRKVGAFQSLQFDGGGGMRGAH